MRLAIAAGVPDAASLSSIYAAIWLLGLLAAAPVLRTRERYPFPDRLRDALVLGVTIPLVLGALDLFYPAACWAALAVCLALAYRRYARSRRVRNPSQPLPYLLIAALVLVGWAPLMRPILDGDSLSYHLPNAAAWVHAHGLWTTDARYWWYPPGSELFASGLFAVSGPFALGWSGFGALALLGFRIVTWARSDFAAPAWLADALAAAVVTAAPLAFQAGSLQNDVWLAALFIEALWTLRHERTASAPTIALTALVKPYGWFFALTAAVAGKAPRGAWFAAIAAAGFWIVHDAILWRSAIVDPASTSTANTWSSTIIAHGLPAIGLLARVCLRASPFALIALLAAAAGPILARRGNRSTGWAALAAVMFFIAMPLAYADANPQLATGASLRFAAPAIALGAILLLRAAMRAPRIAAALLTISAAFGSGLVLYEFWNDGATRAAPAVALVAIGNLALARITGWRWQIPAGFAVAVVACWLLSARQPAAYYRDALSVAGTSSGVYAWLERTKPANVGGTGLLLGTVNVLAPHARAVDLPDDAVCAAARAHRLDVVAVAERGRSAAFNARRLHDARACGRVRYDDGMAVVAGF
jgi:hypothetical protein